MPSEGELKRFYLAVSPFYVVSKYNENMLVTTLFYFQVLKCSQIH